MDPLADLVPLTHRGELVALLSPRRVHVVSPRLLTAPPGDPELRLVAYMCACYSQVLTGALPGPFTPELAETWARMATAGAEQSTLHQDATP